VAEYNKSIADLHTRKGSILEYDGIGFEEGPWPQKAYWDALGRARERDAAKYIDYGWTRPKVISRGSHAAARSDLRDLPARDQPLWSFGTRSCPARSRRPRRPRPAWKTNYRGRG
jgi:hypothetical protein